MTEPLHPEQLRNIKDRHTHVGYWSSEQKDDDIAVLIAECERQQAAAAAFVPNFVRRMRWWMETDGGRHPPAG